MHVELDVSKQNDISPNKAMEIWLILGGILHEGCKMGLLLGLVLLVGSNLKLV